MQTDPELEDGVMNMNKSGVQMKDLGSVNVKAQRYPYCIVWSPLGCLTWLFPFIGHTGICDSEGVIYDFGGPYYIAVDHMTFGSPTKYIQLDPSLCKAMDWDNGIKEGRLVLLSSPSLLLSIYLS